MNTFDDNSLDYQRYDFYHMVSRIVALFIEFYVDLFMLWLLYRFMKPQKIVVNDRTEASALLFAHDGKRAKKILLEWCTDKEELRQREMLINKHKGFIDFVLKDWAAEIATETAVTLEFINQKDRETFYDYAK